MKIMISLAEPLPMVCVAGTAMAASPLSLHSNTLMLSQ